MINYLACPYTHAEEHMEQRRYEWVTTVAAELMRQGLVVYSPITSMHYLARRLKVGEVDWLQHDLTILARCDKLIVLQLEDWEASEGLRKEIEFAREHNIPIEYVEFKIGKNNQHG